MGNGAILTLSVGPGEAETKRRPAKVSGSPYVYALAGWMVDRLFRDAGYFGGL
jgi:hypothetical protein